MRQLSLIEELVIERESSALEHLIQVAARFQDTNPVLYSECMKEIEICQLMIDKISNKKDDEEILEKVSA